MRKIFGKLILACAALVLVTPQVVHADDFLFANTGNAPESLIVTTTGGTTALNTQTNEITSSAYNQGWWSATDSNLGTVGNYIVGQMSGSALNDFFTFDTSALSGATITGATLSVGSGDGSGVLSFGPIVNVTYTLFDVSTPAADLDNRSGLSAAIFNDLGSGTSFGQFTESTGAHGTTLAFDLNSAGVSALQAAADRGSFFSVGGTLTPSPSTVPEPSSLALVGLGAIGLSIGAYRRRRAAAAI